MVGCAFAVQREYFFHIGAFDEGMKIWGGENVELPLRVSCSKCLPWFRDACKYNTGVTDLSMHVLYELFIESL